MATGGPTTGDKRTEMRTAAHTLVSEGWNLTAVGFKGKWAKRPLWPDWPNRPIATAEKVREVFNPSGNYVGAGFLHGQRRNADWYTYGLDVDPHNGGVESLAELEKQFGPLPRSCMVDTPSGGFHFLLRSPVPVYCHDGIRPGIDIKGIGGQTVAPPTFVDYSHKDGRHIVGRYQWRTHGELEDWSGLPSLLASRTSANGSGQDWTRRNLVPGDGWWAELYAYRRKHWQEWGSLADGIEELTRRGQKISCQGGDDCPHDAHPDYSDPDSWSDDDHTRIEKLVAETRTWTTEPDDKHTASIPAPVALPSAPDPVIYHGLAGEVVRTFEPFTEASPVAMLVTFLAAFGCSASQYNIDGDPFGTGADWPHYLLGRTRHLPLIYPVIVGDSSKSRKGESRQILEPFEFLKGKAARTNSGLASGEGVIYEIRDAVYGHDKEGAVKCLDAGVTDKRLLILESEFSRVLKVSGREGNILSEVLRQAWDGYRLSTMTKHSPNTASHPAVSVIGHITTMELRSKLTELDMGNGLGNRFMWFVVERAKLLPEPEPMPDSVVAELSQRIGAALERAQHIGCMARTDAAREQWRERYPDLSRAHAGLAGAVLNRAEAQVLRMSEIYALLDGSAQIDVIHQTAAFALWDYAEQSARYIFGDATGDPVADTILNGLKQAGTDGLTRAEISGLFGRNVKAARIEDALRLLQSHGIGRKEKSGTAGRSVERWFYATAR
jgi:hypothetical protein